MIYFQLLLFVIKTIQIQFSREGASMCLCFLSGNIYGNLILSYLTVLHMTQLVDQSV